jgi:hypothetical protein
MNTLELNELENLKSLSIKLKNIKEEISDIEVSLSRLKTKKQSSLFEIEIAAEELSKFQAELFEKYGNVTIDLSTGEIKNA